MLLPEYKKKVKELGYKCRVQSYSEFKAVTYLTASGEKLPFGVSSIIPPEMAAQHTALQELRQAFKGLAFDGMMRVVI